MRPMIIVHGGAGDIPDSRVQGKHDGIRVAVRVGYQQLMRSDNALDAVEAAVVSMEKDENFNAGYGSVLNLKGGVEMEASIMRGADLNVGAVTLIKDFIHPISIARKVLTDSPHSLLGAEGAKVFALEKGFHTVSEESLISPNARHALNNFLKHGEFGRTEIGSKDEGGVGTVGAVAVDSKGHIAVATSTGGMSGKAVGRIGDTPQIGSGTYADDNIGGVSTTGHGESILKYCLAHSIIKLMESGVDANTATKDAVNAMTARLRNTAGAITLSKDGDVGIYFSSNRMSWAYVDNNKVFYGINQDFRGYLYEMKHLAISVSCLCSLLAYNCFDLKPIIIVHGGAGDIDDSRVQGKVDGVRKAARDGYEVLLRGGSALDAVEAAVVSMEKDEYFNAGYGSVLNIEGEVEMEASIMRGVDLNVGAVTLVKDFSHPISIAHKVLTDSPHSLLGGEGAKTFALEKGFETVPQDSLITNYAVESLYDYLHQHEYIENLEPLMVRAGIRPKYEGGVGTVGAVALDAQGHIASATSTGGLTGKAVGRMGDVPMIGSGTYADDLIGGVSSTGHGESILKYCLAHTIIKLMEQGINADNATKDAINAMTARLNNTAGAITLSKKGDVGIHFSSQRMAWAYIQNKKVFYGIERDEILED